MTSRRRSALAAAKSRTELMWEGQTTHVTPQRKDGVCHKFPPGCGCSHERERGEGSPVEHARDDPLAHARGSSAKKRDAVLRRPGDSHRQLRASRLGPVDVEEFSTGLV